MSQCMLQEEHDKQVKSLCGAGTRLLLFHWICLLTDYPPPEFDFINKEEEAYATGKGHEVI